MWFLREEGGAAEPTARAESECISAAFSILKVPGPCGFVEANARAARIRRVSFNPAGAHSMSLSSESSSELPSDPAPARHCSRPLAGLFALVFGWLGLHRWYLGARGAWLYPMLSMPLIGWALRTDPWFRQPGFFAFSLIVVITLVEAIVISLTSDARWDARFNTNSGRVSANRWAPVFIAIASLIGAAMLGMSVMAIALEGWFNARLGR